LVWSLTPICYCRILNMLLITTEDDTSQIVKKFSGSI